MRVKPSTKIGCLSCFVIFVVWASVTLLANLAFGQAAPPRPTAIQILSNQLAIAIAQNAELHEKVGQLEDRIAKMIQERSQPPKEKPE